MQSHITSKVSRRVPRVCFERYVNHWHSFTVNLYMYELQYFYIKEKVSYFYVCFRRREVHP